jgi:hypothetical protein
MLHNGKITASRQRIASFLKKVGAFKKKGVPAVSIVRELFAALPDTLRNKLLQCA